MGDEDDGLLYALLNAEELVLQTGTGDRVHRPERLIHEHDRGVGGHSPRHPDALLLTTRKLRRIAVSVLAGLQADQIHELVHPFVDIGLIPVEQFGDRGDVLGDSAVREEADTLDRVADLAP